MANCLNTVGIGIGRGCGWMDGWIPLLDCHDYKSNCSEKKKAAGFPVVHLMHFWLAECQHLLFIDDNQALYQWHSIYIVVNMSNLTAWHCIFVIVLYCIESYFEFFHAPHTEVSIIKIDQFWRVISATESFLAFTCILLTSHISHFNWGNGFMSW